MLSTISWEKKVQRRDKKRRQQKRWLKAKGYGSLKTHACLGSGKKGGIAVVFVLKLKCLGKKRK